MLSERNTVRKDKSHSESAPWFQSAAAQFAERIGEGVEGSVSGRKKKAVREGGRERQDWACQICGMECFCAGFAD